MYVRSFLNSRRVFSAKMFDISRKPWDLRSRGRALTVGPRLRCSGRTSYFLRHVRWPTLSNPELRPNQPYRNLTSNPVSFATTAKLVHGSQLSPSNHRHGVRFITCASEVQNTAPVYRSTVPTHKTTRNPARLRGRPPAREANTTCRPATSGSCGIISRCKQRRKPTTSPQRSGVDDDEPARTEENARQPPAPIAGSMARGQCTPQARADGRTYS